MENRIDVLDKGYVRLEAITGSDLSTVNSAKVSYDRRSEVFTEKEKRLINFLATHGHTSPFRHAFVTFEVNAPLMIARQWWKYIIGSAHQDPFTAWNESSRRYITEEVQFYTPDAESWRSKPENSKQGSGLPLTAEEGLWFTEELEEFQQEGLRKYEVAMNNGIAPELARLFLPAYGLYVRWYWSASVQGVAHMLNQRLANDSQKEFQLYARAVYDLMLEHFPVSMKALLDEEIS